MTIETTIEKFEIIKEVLTKKRHNQYIDLFMCGVYCGSGILVPDGFDAEEQMNKRLYCRDGSDHDYNPLRRRTTDYMLISETNYKDNNAVGSGLSFMVGFLSGLGLSPAGLVVSGISEFKKNLRKKADQKIKYQT